MWGEKMNYGKKYWGTERSTAINIIAVCVFSLSMTLLYGVSTLYHALPAGRANDWPYQGVASSPLVEGNKLYYVSNRGVVWCLDIKGFSDGNQGPITDEKLTGPKDADAIWSFDMMEQVGSYPHNLSNSSPVIYGNLIVLPLSGASGSVSFRIRRSAISQGFSVSR